MPGTDGGTRLFNNERVYSATLSGAALSGHSAPGVTMLGFNRIPSNRTLFSAKKKKTFDQTFWATSKVLSIPWLPSRRISGSTMGTNPLSCKLKKTNLQEECRTQISICCENMEAEILENNALAHFFFIKYTSSQGQR
jgi:hypothetical protein